jgi:hypothetical protein
VVVGAFRIAALAGCSRSICSRRIHDLPHLAASP